MQTPGKFAHLTETDKNGSMASGCNSQCPCTSGN